MERKVVAGNWKMNTTLKEGEELIKALVSVDAKGAKSLSHRPLPLGSMKLSYGKDGL